MAIAYSKQIDAGTEFALWKIEEGAEDLYAQLQLDDEEKTFVEQLKHSKRHLHWLATRVLLRTMLHTDEYIDCKIDPHGKPYLVSLPYHISLSHSFEYAAVMISKNGAVGIDIEQIQQKVERIAPRFLNPGELKAARQDPHLVEALYAYWCAKEAVYKCHGQKNVSFANDISLQPFTFTGEGIIQARLKRDTRQLDYKVNYLQYEDYMVGYVKGVWNEK